MSTDDAYIVWGAELSPFTLKLEAMLRASGLPFRRLPRDGSRRENLRTALLIERGKRRRSIVRPPATTPLDEYPLVPFLIAPGGDVLYDTSALAEWIDNLAAPGGGHLLPADAGLRFVCRLIDEAFDEFGLYMVHHNRWVLAAADNDRPGRRLAREYARHLPPGTPRFFATWFARRQVRRLPYLFSVAPPGYRVAGLPVALTPPALPGFPPTLTLLDTAWQRYLAACESLLGAQPYVLGERFTLADASVYGQLAMNLDDPAAARRLRELAPRTYAWLRDIHAGAALRSEGILHLGPALAPLLAAIRETFIPLMQQNAAAWARASAGGEAEFNEAAFERGVALYDGSLLGVPFRSVIKTFQVRVWRELCIEFAALDGTARRAIEAIGGGDMAGLFAPPAGAP